MISEKKISTAEINNDYIYFSDTAEPVGYYRTATFNDPDLVNRLHENGVEFTSEIIKEASPIMTFLLSQYANLKEICEKDVDFCVAFSFDSGEHMTEINSAEDAESFLENLQAQEQVKK